MSEWKNNPVDCSLMSLPDGLWTDARRRPRPTNCIVKHSQKQN